MEHCMSKVLSSDTRFRGRVITVNVETVRLPNGSEPALEIVHHPGGAAVVALDDAGRICVLRQYRHAAGGWLWELPAGKLEPDEAPLVTARRELIEEAGMSAAQWQALGPYLSSPGVFTEVIHLFLAQGLTPVPTRHEEHEVIEVHWMPFAQAWRKALSGEFNDGKTALGVLRGYAQVNENVKITGDIADGGSPAAP
jgi:8-oxo-dGTP pyrophosphatase MutT (NUDIX family)